MEARWGDVRKPWQAHRLDAVMRCKPLPSLSCALQAGVSGLVGSAACTGTLSRLGPDKARKQPPPTPATNRDSGGAASGGGRGACSARDRARHLPS